MKELVSIIIPAHNVERYINRCIQSILKQTYSNIEIILIEDSSTDNTAAICDELSNNNENIIVRHVINKSAGKSRNDGLDIAKGKYVVFVDSDDYIEENMIEIMVKEIYTNSASAVFCAYNEVGKTKNAIYKYGEKRHYYNRKEIEKKLIYNAIYVEDKNKELPLYAVWAGIYDLDIIRKEKIRFLNEDKCYSEDSIFNFEFLCKAEGAITINDALYNYNIENENSICNRYNKRFNYLEEWKSKLIEVANVNNVYSEKLNQYLNKMYLDCLIISVKQEILSSNKGFKEIRKKILNIIKKQNVVKMLNDSKNFIGKSRNKKIMLYLMKYKFVILIYFLVILRSKI